MLSLLADITPLKESPAFRRLWGGMLLSILGAQLSQVAVSLQVFEITGSSAQVGLLGLVSLLPLIVGGLYGGAVIDAHDRRLVALWSAGLLWGTGALIALQAWLGLESVGVIYALVALQSLGLGVHLPARSSIIPHLVRPELLAAANALAMITFGVGGAFGPLLAGFLVARVGYGWTYTIDVATFALAMWALFRLPSLPPRGEKRPAGLTSVVQGLAFLGTRPNLRMTFLLDLSAMVFALPRAVFPAVAALVLGGGAATAGVLLAAVAVGTLLGGLFSGPVGRMRWQGRGVQYAVLAWGGSITALGLVLLAAGRNDGPSPSWWIVPAVLALMVAGGADAMSATLRTTILQAATPDHLLGRLQGVFTVVVAGGPRLGDMFSGGMAGWLGEGWAVVVGGTLCLAAVGVLHLVQPRFAAYDARSPQP